MSVAKAHASNSGCTLLRNAVYQYNGIFRPLNMPVGLLAKYHQIALPTLVNVIPNALYVF